MDESKLLLENTDSESISSKIKQSDSNIKQLWELFCKVHGLSLDTPYLLVDSNKAFTGEATLCWVTDICDIILHKNGYILRKKRLLKLKSTSKYSSDK